MSGALSALLLAAYSTWTETPRCCAVCFTMTLHTCRNQQAVSTSSDDTGSRKVAGQNIGKILAQNIGEARRNACCIFVHMPMFAMAREFSRHGQQRPHPHDEIAQLVLHAVNRQRGPRLMRADLQHMVVDSIRR